MHKGRGRGAACLRGRALFLGAGTCSPLSWHQHFLVGGTASASFHLPPGSGRHRTPGSDPAAFQGGLEHFLGKHKPTMASESTVVCLYSASGDTEYHDDINNCQRGFRMREPLRSRSVASGWPGLVLALCSIESFPSCFSTCFLPASQPGFCKRLPFSLRTFRALILASRRGGLAADRSVITAETQSINCGAW